MRELWGEIYAFNRVEKCFRESDNRKIRFHHGEMTSFVFDIQRPISIDIFRLNLTKYNFLSILLDIFNLIRKIDTKKCNRKILIMCTYVYEIYEVHFF